MITSEFGPDKDLRFNLQTGAITFKGSRLVIRDANDGAVFEIRNKFRLANSQPRGKS